MSTNKENANLLVGHLMLCVCVRVHVCMLVCEEKQ